MTFRITGPGVYVNRRGEKVALRLYPSTSWATLYQSRNGIIYTDEGNCEFHDEPPIVGVWEEPQVSPREEPNYEIPANPVVIGMDGVGKEINQTSKEQPASKVTFTTLKGEAAERYFTNKYDLSKVSERFRALEDGRELSYPAGRGFDVYVTPRNIAEYAHRLIDNNLDWTLVPKTKRVVTKLWVWKDVNGELWTERTEIKTKRESAAYNKCLGAIEGSEQVGEVEV